MNSPRAHQHLYAVQAVLQLVVLISAVHTTFEGEGLAGIHDFVDDLAGLCAPCGCRHLVGFPLLVDALFDIIQPLGGGIGQQSVQIVGALYGYGLPFRIRQLIAVILRLYTYAGLGL